MGIVARHPVTGVREIFRFCGEVHHDISRTWCSHFGSNLCNQHNHDAFGWRGLVFYNSCNLSHFYRPVLDDLGALSEWGKSPTYWLAFRIDGDWWRRKIRQFRWYLFKLSIKGPRRARKLVVGIGAAFGALMAAAGFMTSGNGTPIALTQGCAWPLDNKGTINCVSLFAYQTARSGTQRIAARIIMALLTIHFGVAWSHVRLRAGRFS